MRGESGVCNVCSAPCSSCMHLTRALMGSKADEFSDETGRVNVASQYSKNACNTSSIGKSKACDSLQHTTSETSNLLSVDSSRDSLSENAESRAPLRSFDTSDAIEGTEMLPNKVGEVNENSISCVSRSNDAHLAVNDRNRSVEQKNLSRSLASAGSVGPEESGDAHKSVLSEMVKEADAGSSAPKVKMQEGCADMDLSLISKSACNIVSGRKLEGFTMTCPKTEVETIDDGQGREDETLKCLYYGKQDSKSTESVKVADMKPLQSVSGDESDESDTVEHDVNVCDICGDAGREDMLATCSRCSDGAEHIYCMRKMLRRVPKGQWLCEECKFAEETDNQKLGSDMEGKRMDKAVLSKQFSHKRLTENIEVAPAAKRQAVETRVGSPKPSSPKKMASLSRESSFKSTEKDRLRSAYQTYQSTNDITEAARSPSSGIRLPTAKSTLLKSNSFNTVSSKPKVKLSDDVSQKQKGSKEHASLDLKERAARMMGKSMSFKSPNSGRSHISESKVKMLSSKFTRNQDLKGLKQAKERSIIERRNLSKLDRPSLSTANPLLTTPNIDQTSRGETGLYPVCNNQEPKVVPPDGILSPTSKPVSNLTRKGGETQLASASSTNGACSFASEQKSNQISSKDLSLSSYSRTAEKPRTNVDGTLEDVSPRSGDMTIESDKRRESSTRCRPTVSASPKGVLCPKCKEIGHSSEFCRIGTSQASGTDASAPRTSREEMQRGNRLKDAIHAALLRKPEICKKKRVFDQSDEFSTSNMDLNYEVASQDQLLVSSKLNNVMATEGSRDGQAILGKSTFDCDKDTTVKNLKQLTVQSGDSLYSPKAADSSSVVPSLGKPAMKVVHSNASLSMSILVKTTAIPEYEYIWQGSFELHRGGSFLDLCGGIQAHLSTCASPNVLGVVNKFPNNVPLDEVRRKSVWPTQFHQSGAKEDNIALYFFAKDLESYERHYKNLLDAMIKNDLALKGYFDGVELLIFPSTQLPERLQRWNMLFFLWGVFRTRRADCLVSTEKTCVPSLSDSLDKGAPPVGRTFSKDLCAPKHTDESSASGKSCDAASASNAPLHTATPVCKDHGNKDTYSQEVPSGSKVNLVLQDSAVDSKTNNTGLSGEVKCTGQALQEICPPESTLGTEIKSSIPATETSSSNNCEKMQMHRVTSVDGEYVNTLKIPHNANQEVAVTGRVDDETIPDRKNRAGIAGVGGVILDRVNIDRAKIEQEREWKRDDGYNKTEVPLAGDLRVNSFQSNNRKHRQTALLQTAAPQSDSKKPKIDSSVFYGRITSGETNSVDGTSRGTNGVDDGFGSRDEMGPCPLVEQKRCVEAGDKKVIPKDLATERYFFPVGTRNVSDNSVPWKDFSLRNGDKSRDGFPSLELALGAETKPQNKGILPFFVGLADEKDGQEDKGLDTVADEKDEDVSASLSLSLSFPFSDKEEAVKPVSKSEQLVPERHQVNTSLLLFGRFPDK